MGRMKIVLKMIALSGKTQQSVSFPHLKHSYQNKSNQMCILGFPSLHRIFDKTALNTKFQRHDVTLLLTISIKYSSDPEKLETAMTLAITGQHSITAHKNKIWWWEKGHLWGWNVLQVANFRGKGMGGGGGEREQCNLSAGHSSEKTLTEKKWMYFFLLSKYRSDILSTVS